ncbi:3-hydroxyanthranilate 3,4-dioxygenase-like isoform X1 [Varroa destructor]|uniref:3-hydroxyanthranilate 3,4-dioxygenase n=1 Tax=Varroa destructor TaxID=109461 RepID=A0A7M7JX81_VARDE|nr:3-hydroxyanthranilate 3,4-dioxygenase-like isoform X1 [Varroa destructor]
MSWTNVVEWLKDNQAFFNPPICNKQMHDDGVLSVFFVGGPNQREDYHVERGEELFYQLKGDMILKVREQNRFKDIHIREGEIFLLPGKIPHSPQRFSDTIGLVIERRRLKDVEYDCLRYYVKPGEDPEVLFERWFHVTALGTQLVSVINEFMESEERKTGIPGRKSRLCEPYFEDDTSFQLDTPKSIAKFISDNARILGAPGGNVLVYPTSKYKFHVEVLGDGSHCREAPKNGEAFLYQLSGNGLCEHSIGENMMSQQSTLLLQAASFCKITNEPCARTLFVLVNMPETVLFPA